MIPVARENSSAFAGTSTAVQCSTIQKVYNRLMNAVFSQQLSL